MGKEYWEMKVRVCIPHRKGREEDRSEEENRRKRIGEEYRLEEEMRNGSEEMRKSII
jgi:hypothetical protein